MTSQKTQQTIRYWRKTAAHDYETMNGLFKIKRYSDSLFYGHIVLEKILKGLVVRETKKQAIYSHNLTLLSQDAKLESMLNKQDLDLLAEVNRFNIRARYPDKKLAFYKQCNKNYAEQYLQLIKKLYKKLCLLLKEKK